MSSLITYTAPSGLSLIIAMAGNVRAAAMVPTILEIPEAGSSDLKIYLTLYDADGEMQVPDAAPTVAVANDAGVDRSANLRNGGGASTTMVNESVGVYWLYYRVSDTATKEGIVFTFTSICNTKTLTVKASSEVGDAREIDTKLTYISQELEIDRTYGSAEAGSTDTLLVCSTLTRPSGDYADWHLMMVTGANAGLMRRASSWSLATHTLTLANVFPAAIVAGDVFDLISINTSANRFIGQNDPDNEADSSLVTANRDGSLLERAEDIRDQISNTQGICYPGTVTAVPGANQFTIPALAGLGAGKFNGVTNPYWAFVFRDGAGAGAAPQGELKPITAYDTATGVFTTTAFTAAIAATDEVLIVHPSIARMISLYNSVGDASGSTLGNIYSILGNPGTDLASTIEDINTALLGTVAAANRVAGKKQILQLPVTAAANAGNTTLWTVTTQPCLVEEITIRAKTAAPAHMTTCAINAGNAGILPLIVVGLATQLNLSAIDAQVGSSVLAELPVGATIVMDLQGTGSTAVDLIVTVSYRACANGGYLNPV